jgi:hypothetical protein
MIRHHGLTLRHGHVARLLVLPVHALVMLCRPGYKVIRHRLFPFTGCAIRSLASLAGQVLGMITYTTNVQVHEEEATYDGVTSAVSVILNEQVTRGEW